MLAFRSAILRATTALTLLWAAPGHAADPLQEGFRTPPQVARPQVWWHWMSGNVTWEGAKLDLEWMQRMGIGGVHAFSGGLLEPTVVPHPMPFMGADWRETYLRAVKLAHGMGMDFTIAGSPGWSETGAPWVKPEQAMKKYVWSETEVDGGAGRQTIRLNHPAQTTGQFGDVPREKGYSASPAEAIESYGDGPVVAFRTPADDVRTKPRYSSAAMALPPLDVPSNGVNVPLEDAGGAVVDMTFDKPQTVRALAMIANPRPAFEILASVDGKKFSSILNVPEETAEKPSPQQTFAFDPTVATTLRIRFDAPKAKPPLPGLPSFLAQPHRDAAIAIRLLRPTTGARVDHFEAKAGFQSVVDVPDRADGAGPQSGAIPMGDVIDLSDRMTADGNLDWAPPAGHWTILRFGWSLTGQTNGPAEPASTGLEVDKLDANAVRQYADTLLDKYGKDVGATLGTDGINGLLTDSWEAGAQNWTPAILQDFRRLRGYDATPWLPVLSGRVVESVKRSDDFLFDWRETLKTLIVENHYAVLAAAAHARGMRYYTEAQGDTPRAISDGLSVKAQSDIPTGEYWYRPFATDPGQPSLVADLQEAASAAHLYGKPIVAAEALTVAAGQDPWSFSPAMLKPVADRIFALGVNRILLHESHLQPFVDKVPGLQLGFFGQYFNRNDTWAEYARPWTDYLARTSWMLQQGQPVADIAYFYGERENLTQIFQHRRNVAVPVGYGFDYVDEDALQTALSVQGGHIVNRSAMTYRVIYLPADVDRLTLPAIRRLAALVGDGAVLVGRKPVGGLGIASPDDAVRRVADQLWGIAPGKTVQIVGRGRVYPTGDLAAALSAEKIRPDVDPMPGSDSMLFVHRQTAQADIYFLAGIPATPARRSVTFRVAGRVPEWWSADDGRVEPLAYHTVGDATAVTLPGDTAGAGFVVFRGSAALRSLAVPSPHPASEQTLDGAWRATFQAGRGAPARAIFPQLIDWRSSTDPGIRYFSGAATYTRSLTIDAATAHARRIVLDLGDVRELAQVSVNGKPVGTVWHAPYRIDLTGSLRPGANALAITVVNLWVNRLIGDKQPGATAYAYAPQSPYAADSPLLPSGLLGPVRLAVSP